MKEFLFILIIVAVAVLLLSVRLWLRGKTFVHTHIDGNKEMAKRGIHCVKRMDREERLRSGLQIPEHTDRP